MFILFIFVYATKYISDKKKGKWKKKDRKKVKRRIRMGKISEKILKYISIV